LKGNQSESRGVGKATEAKARRQAIEAKKATNREDKAKAKRQAKEAKENAKREAKEAKLREKREARAAKEAKKKPEPAKKAEPPTEKLKKRMVAEGVELYEGMVTLIIMPPVDPVGLDSLKQALLEIEELRVVMVNGAVGGGSRVLVSAAEPLPLLNILRRIPAVGGVAPKGDEIEVSLEVS
jgi:hypothetical protein